MCETYAIYLAWTVAGVLVGVFVETVYHPCGHVWDWVARMGKRPIG